MWHYYSCRHFLTQGFDILKADIVSCLTLFTFILQLPDKHGISPLLAAIWESHLDAVKLLLSKVSTCIQQCCRIVMKQKHSNSTYEGVSKSLCTNAITF